MATGTVLGGRTLRRRCRREGALRQGTCASCGGAEGRLHDGRKTRGRNGREVGPRMRRGKPVSCSECRRRRNVCLLLPCAGRCIHLLLDVCGRLLNCNGLLCQLNGGSLNGSGSFDTCSFLFLRGGFVFSTDNLRQRQPGIHALRPHHRIIVDLTRLIRSVELLDVHHLDVAWSNCYHPLLFAGALILGIL
jgi:hypothetical protein